MTAPAAIATRYAQAMPATASGFIGAQPSVLRAPVVLQVVLSLEPGGTEQLVVEICKRVQPAFRPIVCCVDGEGAWASKLQASGIDVVALHRPPGFRPEIGLRIARLAARHGARLLHCHHYSPFVYGRIAAWWDRRLKLIYTEHGRLSDAAPSAKRRVVNPILARFDGPIFAVSDELRRYMVTARFPADRVRVIHNGIVAGTLPTSDDRRRARFLLGLDDDAFVAFTVARLDPVKDLVTAIDAFAGVRRQVPRARLVIVGDGPEHDRLAARAACPDVSGAVSLIGYRSDVTALLPAADVYVNSSISEGISLTILEAMAAGLPVVATAVGGTPEVIDSATGVLVPARNPERLGVALTGLALDVRRRGELGRAARRRLEAQFAIERMVDQYVRAYQQLLN